VSANPKALEIWPLTDFDAIFEQLCALHLAHWLETESYRNSEFKPRYDLLRQYWESGIAWGWGAFDGRKLVGHATVYVTTSVHTGEMTATEDALYVLPEYRKGIGADLVRRAMSDLRTAGVSELWCTAKPATRVGAMLERLGMRHVADTYLIRLGDH
jgi:GNAT superfamily N-acetyltransferase